MKAENDAVAINLVEDVDTKQNVQLIPLNCIQVGKQSRTYFSPHSLNLLAQSFQRYGFQGVINVRYIDRDCYEVVAGERRLRAAKLAGLKAVQCIVGDFTPEEALEFALRENLQREDLSKLEETEALLALLSLKLKLEQSHIIEVINKEGHLDRQKNNQPKSTELQQIESLLGSFGIELQTFRTKNLRTLTLPYEIRQAHLEGGLPYSSALEIGKVKDPTVRANVLQEALAQGYSVRDVQSIVQQVAQPSSRETLKPSDRVHAIARRLKKVEASIRDRVKLDQVIDQFIDVLEEIVKDRAS
ncbi:chromosome partitioning protein, ParB family (plasmid) [Leptolyngbya boryana NIES-2135]|jgi:ParB family chromosome partitioning protein|uniref:Chromosome partitioning protein, ParB family n=1 Tax=Leptolyngbya boryana NIES-2135 TaxID=1973484 RepID=A0A1Z4JSH7_LEPBY|nr:MULTISPECIES: ParB/RepB/Spo0J family partition protein [Leptolyngbya]BAY59636.1 chromosome partitioning protein, ParB family [Leptolyngbya boryana NIES-2135]MBD2371181.1 ParB/RepB/Spo0J family partition protein [Leptolyngbya sp. FACHB-161]MBD2377855.1 ParB/RepB/Spo0J family partition protein [Leptolyngbya sp. FACHB-238]MBD2402293.1 ParB/RepB/Spo0J family partition protein [Leptolyngbya sp. FACHB-239]MBD2409036.1 ParB/RepB/Spo0J family partition protein [Leptolyngbya sp. FACHB-402]